MSRRADSGRYAPPVRGLAYFDAPFVKRPLEALDLSWESCSARLPEPSLAPTDEHCSIVLPDVTIPVSIGVRSRRHRLTLDI